MPMIDVYAPQGLFPPAAERPLAEALTAALMRWEGAPAKSPYLENTAAYIHLLPDTAVHTAASATPRTVRVQVLTPPSVLSREAQQGFVKEATAIVARLSGDPTQATRTWVLLTEAAEGGWGINGVAYGRERFAGVHA